MKEQKKYLILIMAVCLNICIFAPKTEAADVKLKTPQITLSNVAASGKIKIKWEPVANAVAYKVYSSQDGKKWNRLITTTKTTVTNTSAAAGKKYYYKVKAIAAKSSANSSFSKIKYRTCDLARPEISLSSNSKTGKTIISWEAVKNVKSYKIYCSKDKKNWNLLKTTEGTKVTHSSAIAGKKYYYKVRAIASKIAANSVYSKIKYRTCKYAKQENLSVYQKEVVELATGIAEKWKTTYTQGKKGEKNSKGVYQFDCSGFATYVINTVMSKEIPAFRLTSSISKLYAMDAVYNEGYPGEFCAKTISLKNIQPGDVIFFSHSSANDHCGIYIGNNKFAHSTKSNGGVAINSISGFYERDLSVVRRYLPTVVTAANTKKTIATTCKLYAVRGDDDSNIALLSKGSKVTVLFTGNNPERYNQAYVKASDGTKGFVYTKNLK